MDKEVERVRPEYLDPIGKKRSGFPWMLLIGAAVVVLAVLGIKQHMETQAAWHARFDKGQRKVPDVKPAIEADQQAQIAAIRKQREEAEEKKIRAVLDEVIKDEEAGNIKCIHGTAFRKIPGGWENIPNIRCSG